MGVVGAATAVLGFRTDRGLSDDPPTAAAPPTAPAPRARAEPQAPSTSTALPPGIYSPVKSSTPRANRWTVRRFTPCPKAQVPQSAGPSDPAVVRAVTAADGLFRFSAKDLTLPSLDGLPAHQPGLLIAAALGYGPDWLRIGQIGSSSASLSLGDMVKEAEMTLTLSRDDVPIRGRLLDPAGRPLAGASVRLAGLNVPWKRDLSAHLEKQKSPNALYMPIDYDRRLATPGVLPGATTEALTDADGRFRFTGLGRDRLARLSIKGPGIADTSIVVMTRDVADVRTRPLGAQRPRDLRGQLHA